MKVCSSFTIHATKQFVLIAPAPVLTDLERGDDGMPSGSVVRCHMPVGRRVTAPDMAACQAEPQMHPLRPDCKAFLTARRPRRDFPDLIKMAATRRPQQPKEFVQHDLALTRACGHGQPTGRTSPTPLDAYNLICARALTQVDA